MELTDLSDPPADLTGLREKVSGIRKELSQATHMPGELYTSDTVFAREKERIFMKQWLCIARLEEFPNPGDYITRKIAGESIIVTRQGDGGVSAFLNMCLHRGVEVAYGDGNTNRFKCPYHAWSYDIGGKLLGAPLRGHGEQLTVDRLPPLRTATWRGWVFVNFDQDAELFRSWIAPFEDKLGFYRTGECRMAARVVVEVPCNWKFVAENLIDWYHAMTLHAETIGKYYRLDSKTFPAELLPKGGSVVRFDSSTRLSDPNFPFPKLPWLDPDGVFSAKAVMFPNLNLSAGSDSLRMWHLWPLTTTTMQAVYYILLPESSFSVPDFDAKLAQYVNYIKSVVAEDRIALESLQRAVVSPHFVPGRLAPLEVEIHHLLRHYVEAMAF